MPWGSEIPDERHEIILIPLLPLIRRFPYPG